MDSSLRIALKRISTTGYLYTATGTAGTGSDHHQKQKDRLRQLRPHIEIRGGKSGGGDDRSYLEKGVPQCLSQSCIERADIPGDRQSTGENDQKIPTNFFDGKSFLNCLLTDRNIPYNDTA